MEPTSIHNSGSLYLLMVVALSVTRSQYRHYSALQGVMGSQLGNGHLGHWKSEHLGCPTDHMILTTGDLGIHIDICKEKESKTMFFLPIYNFPNVDISRECLVFLSSLKAVKSHHFVVTRGG